MREVDFAPDGKAEFGVDEGVDAVAAFEVAGAVGEVGLLVRRCISRVVREGDGVRPYYLPDR